MKTFTRHITLKRQTFNKSKGKKRHILAPNRLKLMCFITCQTSLQLARKIVFRLQTVK